MQQSHVAISPFTQRISFVASCKRTFTRCDVFCDLQYYSTHAQKDVIYLFYIIKIQMLYAEGLQRNIWGMEKDKDKSADVI